MRATGARQYLGMVLTNLLIAMCILGFARAGTASELRVTFNSEWAPYSFGSRDGVRGILPDLVGTVMDGLPGYQWIRHGQAWATVERSVRRSRYDAFVTTPTADRLKFALRSKGVLYAIRMVPVVKRGSAAESELRGDLVEGLRRLRICGIKGNGWEEKFYSGMGLRYGKVKNVARCLEKIASGKADVVIQAQAVGLKLTSELGYAKDLAVLRNAVSEVGFPLLVRNTYPGADALIAAFDARLSEMKARGDYDRIVEEVTRKWTSQGTK